MADPTRIAVGRVTVLRPFEELTQLAAAAQQLVDRALEVGHPGTGRNGVPSIDELVDALSR